MTDLTLFLVIDLVVIAGVIAWAIRIRRASADPQQRKMRIIRLWLAYAVIMAIALSAAFYLNSGFLLDAFWGLVLAGIHVAIVGVILLLTAASFA